MKCNYTKQIRNAVSLCAVGVMSLALFGEAQTASADTYIVAPMADTYLQSDGTQAIDTGYYASGRTKVVIDFEIVSTNRDAAIFGSYGNGLPYRLGLNFSISSQKFAYNLGGSDREFTNAVPLRLTRYTATFDAAAPTVTVSNGLVGASMAGTSNENMNNVPLAVFCRQTALGKFNAMSAIKIYSMQIYDDGTLVRDFIPYGRDTTTGLYDRVNGKVHENARENGNPFVIGHDDAYVRGSTSAPVYVNTDIAPSSNVKVEIDYALMTTNAKARVFGVTVNNELVVDLHIHTDGNALRYCMHDASVNGSNMKNDDYELVRVDPERHLLTLDGKENTVRLTSENGTIIDYLGAVGPHSLSTQQPMFIFGAPGSGTLKGANPCDVKVYGMKIWDDVEGQRTLLRDFTPRMEGGEYGFWDSVSQQFFGRFVDANNNHLRGGGAMESDADPISACTVTPQGGEVPVNGTLTLTATAPGAIGYQWFLDGEMLEGANSISTLANDEKASTLVVEWTKDTRLVRKYKCIAFFNVFGYAESTEAVLTNAPAATVIIMK